MEEVKRGQGVEKGGDEIKQSALRNELEGLKVGVL